MAVATGPAAAASAMKGANSPLPPPRPADLVPAPAPAPAPAPVPQPPAEVAPPGASSCRDRLAAKGVVFEAASPLRNGACGAAEPLLVSRLPGGVELSPAATMVCPVAEALALWTEEAVTPAAQHHMERPPTKILIGTSYECRNRNRQEGGQLSEHAFANALDVIGFAFSGRPNLLIAHQATEDTPEALFGAAIRAQACAYFTTVLGPGADEAHADHLHLDLRVRRGGLRLCQ
ncbi:hypothetical protein GGR16_002165 [Chelatococcus caeni]|uniref:Extensin-like C-terminal domain-containing protein n=1 Tax=Chelatococcus caeni TaxID=1348468 RepID=A0A840C2G3_9HYPH|nr:extensin family protein [Chelatococcus caeni]MBB4017136.1 hypothetical protein [Chelatococcus caeni]